MADMAEVRVGEGRRGERGTEIFQEGFEHVFMYFLPFFSFFFFQIFLEKENWKMESCFSQLNRPLIVYLKILVSSWFGGSCVWFSITNTLPSRLPKSWTLSLQY